MAPLVLAFFITIVVERIVNALVEPIRKKWPDLDLWWLIYVTWVFGGFVSWLAKINLFEVVLPDQQIAGLLLTAVVVGGGANLLHDIFDNFEA